MKLLWQIIRFGIVGVCASATHCVIVVLLVQFAGFKPLIANVYGFCTGFQVSYLGHHTWTFKYTEVSHRVALPRLLLIQSVSFVANEVLFYSLLLMRVHYLLALFIVLAILAVLTFVASKLWVFR